MKTKVVAFRMDAETLSAFEKARLSQGQKQTQKDIIIALMIAYTNLVKKCKGKPIITLELNGCDDDDKPIRGAAIARPLKKCKHFANNKKLEAEPQLTG